MNIYFAHSFPQILTPRELHAQTTLRPDGGGGGL